MVNKHTRLTLHKLALTIDFPVKDSINTSFWMDGKKKAARRHWEPPGVQQPGRACSSFRRVVLSEVIATVVPFEAETMSVLVTNTTGSVGGSGVGVGGGSRVRYMESCLCSWCRLE